MDMVSFEMTVEEIEDVIRGSTTDSKKILELGATFMAAVSKKAVLSDDEKLHENFKALSKPYIELYNLYAELEKNEE